MQIRSCPAQNDQPRFHEQTGIYTGNPKYGIYPLAVGPKLIIHDVAMDTDTVHCEYHKGIYPAPPFLFSNSLNKKQGQTKEHPLRSRLARE